MLNYNICQTDKRISLLQKYLNSNMPCLESITLKYLNFNTIRLSFIKSLLDYSLSLYTSKLPSNLELTNAWIYGRDEGNLEIVQFDSLSLCFDHETEFHIIVSIIISPIEFKTLLKRNISNNWWLRSIKRIFKIKTTSLAKRSSKQRSTFLREIKSHSVF